mmetsp:Transcript_60692/g.113416  ORF Transcript_60692/g.113416 Transcript_60692/m.113416 type:complete len:230 (+) Transcript_60692:1414-2103(+)
MRCQDDIRHPHQRGYVVIPDTAGREVPEEVGPFVLHDVEGGPADRAVLEALDECFGVDQPAPRRVDDNHALLQERQLGLVDHVLCRGQKRSVEGDEVTSLQQIVELQVWNAKAIGLGVRKLRVREDVMRHHLALEALLEDRGCNRANQARSDDADPLAVHVLAQLTIQLEVHHPAVAVGVRNPPVQGEKQSYGMLANRVGAVGWNSRHGDTGILGGAEVNAVESGAAQR